MVKYLQSVNQSNKMLIENSSNHSSYPHQDSSLDPSPWKSLCWSMVVWHHSFIVHWPLFLSCSHLTQHAVQLHLNSYSPAQPTAAHSQASLRTHFSKRFILRSTLGKMELGESSAWFLVTGFSHLQGCPACGRDAGVGKEDAGSCVLFLIQRPCYPGNWGIDEEGPQCKIRMESGDIALAGERAMLCQKPCTSAAESIFPPEAVTIHEDQRLFNIAIQAPPPLAEPLCLFPLNVSPASTFCIV